jgi:5,10-methylenetetrahydrofolate reductase
VVATCLRGGLDRAQWKVTSGLSHSLTVGVLSVMSLALVHRQRRRTASGTAPSGTRDRSLANWNDDAARTVAEVRDLLDKATKIADDLGL